MQLGNVFLTVATFSVKWTCFPTCSHSSCFSPTSFHPSTFFLLPPPSFVSQKAKTKTARLVTVACLDAVNWNTRRAFAHWTASQRPISADVMRTLVSSSSGNDVAKTEESEQLEHPGTAACDYLGRSSERYQLYSNFLGESFRIDHVSELTTPILHPLPQLKARSRKGIGSRPP